MDILPLPGTDSDIVTKKHCLMMIDVGWFQIGSTCLSIIRFLATAFWIVEPVVKETNCAIGKLTLVPLFFTECLFGFLL